MVFNLSQMVFNYSNPDPRPPPLTYTEIDVAYDPRASPVARRFLGRSTAEYTLATSSDTLYTPRFLSKKKYTR